MSISGKTDGSLDLGKVLKGTTNGTWCGVRYTSCVVGEGEVSGVISKCPM